jgi:ribosomal protein L24E
MACASTVCSFASSGSAPGDGAVQVSNTTISYPCSATCERTQAMCSGEAMLCALYSIT